jgi:hypothetical protein
MSSVCFESSLLELWGNNGAYDDVTEREIGNLTQQTLLDKINSVNKSGIFLSPKNFANFLGEISYDGNGKIVGAKAMVIQWLSRANLTLAQLEAKPGTAITNRVLNNMLASF